MTKCKQCGEQFTRKRLTQKVCDYPSPCAAEWGKREAVRRRIEQDRLEYKASKERLKKLTDYENEAQRYVNSYVKWRDWGLPCISCDKPHGFSEIRHASHFKSVGANTFLRFNLWNINMSCHQCNWKKGGNILEYIPRLEKKIGVDKVEYLKNAPRQIKFTKEYLVRLKEIFIKKSSRQKFITSKKFNF